MVLELARNPDILAELGARHGRACWLVLLPRPMTWRRTRRRNWKTRDST